MVVSGFFGIISFSAFGGVVQLHKHKIASGRMDNRPLNVLGPPVWPGFPNPPSSRFPGKGQTTGRISTSRVSLFAAFPGPLSASFSWPFRTVL